MPKRSFLGVGDPKVRLLGTGDGGSRRGGVGELGRVDAIDSQEEVEEMDIAEEPHEVLALLLLYD